MAVCKHTPRAPYQAPIATPRFKVFYLVDGREKESPWLHDHERARAALGLMQAKYGQRNCMLFRD